MAPAWSRHAGGAAMAKGQKKSNKEVRKPKQEKKAPPPPSFSFGANAKKDGK
jgi:hypothetical protein